jgi:hypothetical protein
MESSMEKLLHEERGRSTPGVPGEVLQKTMAQREAGGVGGQPARELLRFSSRAAAWLFVNT